MFVDFPSVCMCAEGVFPVPCTSTPAPPRFPETCAYYQEILTVPGVDLTAQLIVFWSKALLRHPQARSSLEEITTGTAFQRYIPDPHPDNLVPPNEIRRHILCTGMHSQLGKNPSQPHF
jgi:2-oxoglutarate dehydrogenase complex dehydrogenase (E1) component-like enzyme